MLALPKGFWQVRRSFQDVHTDDTKDSAADSLVVITTRIIDSGAAVLCKRSSARMTAVAYTAEPHGCPPGVLSDAKDIMLPACPRPEMKTSTRREGGE